VSSSPKIELCTIQARLDNQGSGIYWRQPELADFLTAFTFADNFFLVKGVGERFRHRAKCI
jgi:hypothetical protein